MARNITEPEAITAIDTHHIIRVAERHPACIIFELGNHARLTFWPGDRDVADGWELTDEDRSHE